MKTNTAVKTQKVYTHEGARAQNPGAFTELRRTVLTCMLFEDTFYESGADIAARIAQLVKEVTPEQAAATAVEARNKFYLRHVPLFVTRELARRTKEKGVGTLVASTLETIIQRADELGEFLSLYWKDGKQPLAASVKRGLARAFTKFSAYNLAKYNRDATVKLRDVMFLTHPKPEKGQKVTFRKLANKELESPDTWEVELSAGKDKRETFERLLREEKLGGLATLRNLRNMQESGVDERLIRERLEEGEFKKVLPFRFLTAAKYAPTLEDSIEKAMFRAIETLPDVPGRTGILVDGSGSMSSPISAKTEVRRIDVAAALAVILRQKSPGVNLAVYSSICKETAPRFGISLGDALTNCVPSDWTLLKKALVQLAQTQRWAMLDRLIVITDEQSHDGIFPAWTPSAYVINVAPYKNGISYGNGWTHIDGFSERILDFILEAERE